MLSQFSRRSFRRSALLFGVFWVCVTLLWPVTRTRAQEERAEATAAQASGATVLPFGDTSISEGSSRAHAATSGVKAVGGVYGPAPRVTLASWASARSEGAAVYRSTITLLDLGTALRL